MLEKIGLNDKRPERIKFMRLFSREWHAKEREMTGHRHDAGVV
jgi:hypothetical protein